MKNKTLFSDWSEVTSGERNEIVFERLNKTYGAYQIRVNYDRTLLMAFSGIGLAVALFVLSSFLLRPAGEKPVPPLTEDQLFNARQVDPIKQIEQPKIPTQPTKTKTNEVHDPVIVPKHEKEDDKDILADNHITTPTGNTPCDSCPDNPNVLIPTGPPDPPIEETVDWFGDLEKLPQFKKGPLNKYLGDNVRIPQITLDRGHKIKEKVGVSFIIDKEGNVVDVKLVATSKYPELNEEALRVIKNMPAWEPGEQKGHAVKVRMIQPLRFEVNE